MSGRGEYQADRFRTLQVVISCCVCGRIYYLANASTLAPTVSVGDIVQGRLTGQGMGGCCPPQPAPSESGP